MNDEEKVLNKTILNTGVASPISISKEEALKQAQNANAKMQSSNNIAEAIPITKEELDEQKVNELNDLMKSDYVKVVEVHHKKSTYVILFLVLALIVGIIVFEIIYFLNK